jgi:CrcB protein
MSVPLSSLLIVACGGAVGSAMRYALGASFMSLSLAFPWGILLINVLGSGAMGALAGWEAFARSLSPSLKLLLMTGVLGGFTTFSAFTGDAVMLLERGDFGKAALYIFASVGLSILAFVGAMQLVKVLTHG